MMKPSLTHVDEMLEAVCGAHLQYLEAVRPGANSWVYKVTATDGHIYLLKQYPTLEVDRRDRLATEFNALKLMWRFGVECVPRPLAADPPRRVALYTFLPGRKLEPEEIGVCEIAEALSFLSVSSRARSGRSVKRLTNAWS